MTKFLLILFLFSYSFNLYSKIERVSIDPKNRANIFFNTIPQYKSELSDTKKNIILKIKNTEYNPNYSQVSSSGIIKYVSISKSQTELNLNIELSTQRGYTAIPLPYSNSVIVEAFSWDGISPDEDKYREALLAYESGQVENTKQLLDEIKDKDIANAKAIYGLILLKEGNIEKGAELIFEANKDSSTIYDVYAAMAEIFKWKGLNSEFAKNDSIFKEVTKLDSYPSFAFNGNKESLEIPEYYYTQEAEEDDSLLEGDSTITDASSGTFLKDYEEKSISELFGFSDSYILFILVLIILSGIMLFYVYGKWKQSKIKEYKDMSKERFNEEIKEARKKQQEKIKDSVALADNKAKENKEETTKKGNVLQQKYGQGKPNSARLDNIQQFRVRPTKNVKETTNKEQLEKFLTNYIPIKRQEETEKKEQEIDKDSVYDADTTTNSTSSSPDMNLALKLAEEKNRIKQKQLIDLAKKKIESNKEDLLKEAKELGLEKGSIEEKIHLDELKENKDMISKLNKKFNVDNSKDGDKNND